MLIIDLQSVLPDMLPKLSVMNREKLNINIRYIKVSKLCIDPFVFYKKFKQFIVFTINHSVYVLRLPKFSTQLNVNTGTKC